MRRQLLIIVALCSILASAQAEVLITTVVNAATGATRISPGSLIRIGVQLADFGTGLRPAVLLDGQPVRSAHVEDEPDPYVALPPDLRLGQHSVEVVLPDGRSAAFSITVERVAPGWNEITQPQPYLPSMPCLVPQTVLPGAVITGTASGLGDIDPDGVPLERPSVTVDGRPADLIAATWIGNGLYQVQFRVPDVHGFVSVVISSGGSRSQPMLLPVGDIWEARYSLGLQLAAANSLVGMGSCGGGFGAGLAVTLRDVEGVERPANVVDWGATGARFVVPSGTAEGIATVTMTAPSGYSVRGFLDIRRFAMPEFGFSPMVTGYVVRVRDGVQTVEASYRLGRNGWWCFGVDLGRETDEVYLVILTTGIRNRSSLGNVRALISDIEAPVVYAGPEGDIPGRDQINIKLPRSLAGRGLVPMQMIVDGIRWDAFVEVQ